MHTIEIIKRLLDSQELTEGEFIEFKRRFPAQEDILAKLLVGFANSQGGYVIIGVGEKPKGISIVGIEKDTDKLHHKLREIVEKYTTGLLCNLHLETVENRNVAIIKVEKSDETVYFSRKETSPERLTLYTRNSESQVVASVKMQYTRVYKYMTLEAFIMNMYGKSLRFVEPSLWKDKFESRFYCAKYLVPHKPEDIQQLFATCVTRCRNNEAAWKVYSHGQGLGSHCVQLELDIVKLREELRKNSYRIEEKPVDYRNEYYIMNLHSCESRDYKKYFRPINFDRFLDLLTLKRDAYTHEQEIRLFAIPKQYNSPNQGKDAVTKNLKVDWKNIIRKVKIDANCTDAELLSIQQACFYVGINPVIKGYKFLCDLPKSKDCVDIEFVRFDIDAMPGSQCIEIK